MSLASSTVSVIIVNYNQRELLRSCLISIQSQSYQNLEILVVDNASSDGSAAMLEQEFSSVEVITNSNNAYFCAAANQGIRAAQGDFIFCVNNDVELRRDFVKNIMQHTSVDNQVGMWGGKLLRFDRATIDSTALVLGRNRKPYDRGYNQKDFGQYEEEGYIFGVNAACVLFRKEMLWDICIDGQYFDEDFKMFYEDLDVCWRAQRFGWKAFYVPEAVAYHHRGASTQKDKDIAHAKKYMFSISNDLQALVVMNRYATILKNDTAVNFLTYGIFILWYDALLWLYLLLCRQKTVLIVFRNRKKISKAFAKRQTIKDKLRLKENSNDLP